MWVRLGDKGLRLVDYLHSHIESHEVWLGVQEIPGCVHLTHKRGQIIHSYSSEVGTSVVARLVWFRRCIV